MARVRIAHAKALLLSVTMVVPAAFHAPVASAYRLAGSRPVPTAVLARVARAMRGEPVRVTYTMRASNGIENVHGIVSYDPRDHEEEGTQTGVFRDLSGVTTAEISSHFIVIGSRAWSESTPPGGGWHVARLPRAVRPPIPLVSELLRFFVAVHALTGHVVRGQKAVGVEATLDPAGVKRMESVIYGQPATTAPQTLRSVRLKIWASTAHYRPILIEMMEAVTQESHVYQIDERAWYGDWGRGLKLSPPTESAPELSSLSPTQGPAGTVVTLSGSDFGLSPGRVTFTANSGHAGAPALAAAIRRWAPDAIEVVVPADLPPGPASPSIWTAAGLEAGPASNAAWPQFFVTAPAPVVTGFSPSFVSAGATLTITGRNFGATPGHVTFCQFCGTKAEIDATGTIASWSATQVEVEMPGMQNGGAEVHLITASRGTVLVGTVFTGGSP